MIHRLKLRLIYGEQLDADRAARRLKLKVIFASGLAVYFPFLFIGYFLYSQSHVGYLVTMAVCSSLTCVPVALYAYAKGFGQPVQTLFRERPQELKWFSIKIGLIYAFLLYWMILGIVEFLFGYQIVRAAMISFVASAVARDGFEIGYLRAREAAGIRTIFPDGRSLAALFTKATVFNLLWPTLSVVVGGASGWLIGPLLAHPIYQTLSVGLVGGLLSTVSFAASRTIPLDRAARVRFFLWPGFTMACTYFFILGYLLRFVFQVGLAPASDLALLMAACCGWGSLDAVFLAHLKNESARPSGSARPAGSARP